MPLGIGQWEILILAAVLVLVFGTSKVPRIARELGLGIRDLKKTMDDVDPRKPIKEMAEPLEELDPRKPIKELTEPAGGEATAAKSKPAENGSKKPQSAPPS